MKYYRDCPQNQHGGFIAFRSCGGQYLAVHISPSWSGRPRLLFVFQRADDEKLFFSSPQPQNPYEKSLTVGHHVCVINPITGKYVRLPRPCRSEKFFKFIDYRFGIRLVNYKGKLGGIDLTYDECDAIELCMWVLEDVKKHEWSKHVYTLPKIELLVSNVFVVGVTLRGEIVLPGKFISKPFYVFYFSPERNILQSVEIKGVGDNCEAFETNCRVYVYVDHVEDLNLVGDAIIQLNSATQDDDDDDGYEDGDYDDNYDDHDDDKI
ncbi:unnamed protein product [Cochlearia groenlandica]